MQTKSMQHNSSDEEEEGGHPFSEAIMAFPMPKNLKASANVDPYYGNSDPHEHVDSFLVAMYGLLSQIKFILLYLYK
ncbi:MAG: hypothetical protein Q8877_02830 [Sweet potato little leaf phytoplasma]|nr:hypothetical protein [Sweet potato little leaf phytoplasma]